MIWSAGDLGLEIDFGSDTLITLASGVSSVGGLLIAYKAETATVAVTDGSIASGGTGGTGAALTVGPDTATAYRITVASATPTAGATDQLTITLVDQYRNTVTTDSSTKNMVFSGVASGPDGTVATVVNDSAADINVGSATAITLSSAVVNSIRPSNPGE